MATIDDLKKSVSQMSEAEILERIRQVRLSRRTTKESRKKGKKKEGAMLSTKSLLDTIDGDSAKRLLEALGEAGKTDE